MKDTSLDLNNFFAATLHGQPPKSIVCVSSIVMLCLSLSAWSQEDASTTGPLTADVVATDDQVTLATPELTYEEQKTRSFALYKEQLENQLFDEAAITAKRLVELTIRNRGPQHKETAAALINLAIVQFKLEEYELAALNFEASIHALEEIEDRLYMGLINPLKGLGASQVKLGKPSEAVGTFDRALHISHVNEGPQNLLQIEMLDSLSEIYISLGDFKEADNLSARAYNLNARQFDPDSLEIIPALYKRAEWLLRIRKIQALRNTYLHIVRIIEENRGDTDLSLIRPLTGLGKAYLYQDLSTELSSPAATANYGYGDTYLKRALRIAEQNPDATWQHVVNANLELGDYYTLSNNRTRARKHYRASWDLLSEGDERLELRARELERVNRKKAAVIPEYLNNTTVRNEGTKKRAFKTGYVVVGFDITRRGYVNNLVIIETDPSGLKQMERMVLRSIRQTIYRPRFENGEPVPTLQQTYRHKFYYRDEDLPKSATDPTPAKAE